MFCSKVICCTDACASDMNSACGLSYVGTTGYGTADKAHLFSCKAFQYRVRLILIANASRLCQTLLEASCICQEPQFCKFCIGWRHTGVAGHAGASAAADG